MPRLVGGDAGENRRSSLHGLWQRPKEVRFYLGRGNRLGSEVCREISLRVFWVCKKCSVLLNCEFPLPNVPQETSSLSFAVGLANRRIPGVL